MSDKFDMYRQLLSEGSTSETSLFCDLHSDDVIPIGGTKEQTFNLPFNQKLIKKMVIVYVQDNKIVLKKNLEDCLIAYFDSSLLYFTLSEVETTQFKEGEIQIQMKILLEDGSIIVSDILYANAIKTLGNTYFNYNDNHYISIKVNVNLQNVDVITLNDIAAGSEMIQLCKFDFDPTWDNYQEIFACFKDEYNNLNREIALVHNMCLIPPEFLTGPGNLYIGAIGHKGSLKRPTEWSSAIRINSSVLYTPETSSSQGGGGGGGSDVPYADEYTAGIMKLYNTSGYNTDGTITQKKITEGFDQIEFSTENECLVLPDVEF